MRRIADEYGLAQAQEAGVPVVRYGPLAWDEVEPERMVPASYRWEAVQDFEQDLMRAAQAGIDVMLFVHSTPDWAQAIPGHSCGPIAEDSLDEFARFLQAAVARYSQPPFNVKYWELFNEPDVDPALVRPDSEFGCWGDQDDEYYGGKRFARMLESVFPAIKEADAGVQVILGGLLLDAPDTDAATFLAGVLEAGGGDYFDILAFHAYTFYSPDFYNWSTLPGGKWNDRGGVVVGKATFMRQMLDSYGYEKPIILNEAGLAWFGKEKPSEDYRQAQADYVVKLYARGLALELGHISWYGWQGPGWRHMGLLLNDLSPTPAYHAYVFAMQQLDRVEYLGPVDYPGTEGYTFRRNDGLLQVIWSADGTSYPVSVPSIRFLSAFDRLGQPVRHDLLPDGYLFDVHRPIYLLLAPEQ